MLRAIIIFIVLLVAVSATGEIGAVKHAAGGCHDRKVLRALLKNNFGELTVAWGFLSNKALVEIYVNSVSRDWTLTVTQKNGNISCLIMAGSNWNGGVGDRAIRARPK